MLSRVRKSLQELLQLPDELGSETARLQHLLSVALAEIAELRVRQVEYQRETRLLLGQMSLPAEADWAGRRKPGAKPTGAKVFPSSTVCRQESFETPCFPYWMAQLGLGQQYHRKLWEFMFICQALFERGMLKPGMRGLGFGVGEEALAAYFASQGCKVTGTDLGGAEAAHAGWTDTHEHAAGKETLRFPAICPDAVFDANVEFRTCDMNAVPDDLTGYDFCWSACALEHLGSIEHSLAFIERSIDCLKPGGFAVHTTEYNVNSDSDTVSVGPTVLLRRRDLQALNNRLTAKGHVLAPLDLDPGSGLLDVYLDVAPYRSEPHVKLALMGYATTSVGLIVQKKA